MPRETVESSPTMEIHVSPTKKPGSAMQVEPVSESRNDAHVHATPKSGVRSRQGQNSGFAQEERRSPDAGSISSTGSSSRQRPESTLTIDTQGTTDTGDLSRKLDILATVCCSDPNSPSDSESKSERREDGVNNEGKAETRKDSEPRGYKSKKPDEKDESKRGSPRKNPSSPIKKVKKDYELPPLPMVEHPIKERRSSLSPPTMDMDAERVHSPPSFLSRVNSLDTRTSPPSISETEPQALPFPTTQESSPERRGDGRRYEAHDSSRHGQDQSESYFDGSQSRGPLGPSPTPFQNEHFMERQPQEAYNLRPSAHDDRRSPNEPYGPRPSNSYDENSYQQPYELHPPASFENFQNHVRGRGNHNAENNRPLYFGHENDRNPSPNGFGGHPHLQGENDRPGSCTPHQAATSHHAHYDGPQEPGYEDRYNRELPPIPPNDYHEQNQNEYPRGGPHSGDRRHYQRRGRSPQGPSPPGHPGRFSNGPTNYQGIGPQDHHGSKPPIHHEGAPPRQHGNDPPNHHGSGSGSGNHHRNGSLNHHESRRPHSQNEDGGRTSHYHHYDQPPPSLHQRSYSFDQSQNGRNEHRDSYYNPPEGRYPSSNHDGPLPHSDRHSVHHNPSWHSQGDEYSQERGHPPHPRQSFPPVHPSSSSMTDDSMKRTFQTIVSQDSNHESRGNTPLQVAGIGPGSINGSYGEPESKRPRSQSGYPSDPPNIVQDASMLTANTMEDQPSGSRDRAPSLTGSHDNPTLSEKQIKENAEWKSFFQQLVAFKEKNGHCHVPAHYPQNQALAQWCVIQRSMYRARNENRHSTLTDERLHDMEQLGFLFQTSYSSHAGPPMYSSSGGGSSDFNPQKYQVPPPPSHYHGQSYPPPTDQRGDYHSQSQGTFGGPPPPPHSHFKQGQGYGEMSSGQLGRDRENWHRKEHNQNQGFGHGGPPHGSRSISESQGPNRSDQGFGRGYNQGPPMPPPGFPNQPNRYSPDLIASRSRSPPDINKMHRYPTTHASYPPTYNHRGGPPPPPGPFHPGEHDRMTGQMSRDTSAHLNGVLGKFDSRSDAQGQVHSPGGRRKPRGRRPKSENKERVDHQTRWMQMYQELIKFKEQHGHAHVPSTYKPNPALSNWCVTQRSMYRSRNENSYTTLSDERLDLLQRVGFVWAIQGLTIPWEARFEQLADYKKKHGTCSVSRKDPRHKSLASWVMNQRTQLRLLRQGKPSHMTQDRAMKLDSIGFNDK